MKIKLFVIQQRGNSYCGPSALSALIGLPTNTCATIIRATSSNYDDAIRGLSTRNLRMTLSACGFGTAHFNYVGKPNLRAFVKEWGNKDEVFLVVAGNHFILVNGKHALCGISKDLVHVDDHPFARKFVTEVYRLFKTKEVDASSLIPYEKKPEYVAARPKVKRLAKQYDIEIEIFDSGTIMVYPPSGLYDEDNDEDQDPYYGDHNADSWDDALRMVQEYISLVDQKASQVLKAV